MFNINIVNYLRKFRFKSIYLKMFTVFIIIFFASILISATYSYNHSAQIIQKKVHQLNYQSLQSVELEIENSVDKINDITINIISRYLTQINKDYEHLSLDEKIFASDSFFKQFLLTDFIESIYILYDNDKKIVYNNGDFNYEIYDNLEWIKQYKDAIDVAKGPYYISRSVKINNQDRDILTISRVLPLFESRKQANIIVNVNKDKLFNTVEQTSLKEQLYISVRGNEVILGDNEIFNQITSKKEYLKKTTDFKNPISFVIGNRNYLASRVESLKTGWTFMKVQNLDDITEDIKGVRKVTIIINALCFLLGSMIWIVFSVDFYNPILSILERINPNNDVNPNNANAEKNEMVLLGKLVEDIISSKHNMEALYEDSKVDIANGILLSLFGKGEQLDISYITRQFTSMGFPYHDRTFTVFIIKVGGLDADNNKDALDIEQRMLAILKQTAMDKFQFLYGDLGNDRRAVLASTNGNDSIVVQTAIELNKKLQQDYGIGITIGVGNATNSISLVNDSYNGALKALAYKVFTGKCEVIHIKDLTIKDDVPNYFYPSKKEIEFIDALKKGDQKHAVAVIDEIFTSIPKTLSMVPFVSDILRQMVNAVFLSMNLMGLKFEAVLDKTFIECYQEYSSLEHLDDIIVFIKNLVAQVTEYVYEKRKHNNEDVIDKVKDYIHAHYNESFSLTDVASVVYMSPSYISTMFKENIGDSFGDYVKKVRMEKAMSFLKDSNKDVNFIATKVGYENSRSFLRVFKNYTGMTPSEYRKKYVTDNMNNDLDD